MAFPCELLQQVDPNIRNDVNSGKMYRTFVEKGVTVPNNFETDQCVCLLFQKVIINENVSRTTEIYESKIFSMKYIFLPYYFYLTQYELTDDYKYLKHTILSHFYFSGLRCQTLRMPNASRTWAKSFPVRTPRLLRRRRPLRRRSTLTSISRM